MDREKMKKVSVAIIDSGIKHTMMKKVDTGISFYKKPDGSIFASNDIVDTYGHGTAIASIIMKCNIPISLNIIKIFNTNTIDSDLLFFSLNYVYENLNVDIINMSFGLNTCECLDELYHICKKLAEKNVILVSSFDNSGSISYPAAFDCVIGVKSGELCNNIREFEYVDDTIINLCAKGNIQRVQWTTPEYIFIQGNSFAAAHATSMAVEYLHTGSRTLYDIKERFKKDSVKQHIPFAHIPTKKIPSICKAAIFPFNKEMHSLIRFSDMLQFEITHVYDVRYSGNINVHTSHIIGDNDILDYNVENINDIDWNSFDTIIVGHTDQIVKLTNSDFDINNLLNTAKNNGKKIILCDNNVPDFLRNYSNIYFPEIKKENVPSLRFGMLYSIGIPVIGIFGTSSKQGKFTLQLQLRKQFLNAGYQVGQIGTEPTSLLYGMDYVFPMGYNDSVFLSAEEIIRYLNHCAHSLETQKKELIIVGCQSGTIPYDYGNIEYYTMKQQAFLYGTLPDVVCLCINPYDDFEHIEKTINSIETISSCKVCALVVFPMQIDKGWLSSYGHKTILTDDEYTEIKTKLTSTFGINVFRLGDNLSIQNLFEHIICYLS